MDIAPPVSVPGVVDGMIGIWADVPDQSVSLGIAVRDKSISGETVNIEVRLDSEILNHLLRYLADSSESDSDPIAWFSCQVGIGSSSGFSREMQVFAVPS
ncbi:hypothetical protein ACFXO9_25750 [Nocardia tengchongensis]|uniref:hypothetical protein n=1 Tax=Nocardia tengchongensis TaxID=2055889 RepID=UPI0036A2FF2B